MGLYNICAYNIFSFISTVTYVVLIKDESLFVRVVYDGYDGGNNGDPLTKLRKLVAIKTSNFVVSWTNQTKYTNNNKKKKND